MLLKLKETYLNNRIWFILLAVTLIPLIFFLVISPIWRSSPAYSFNPETVRTYILSFGNWAIFIFFLVGILMIVAPPIPNEVVVVAGAIIFGFWRGLIYALIIKIIGSTINYWLGAKIRQGIYVKLISNKEQEKLKKYTYRIGWQVVLLSRFLPGTDTDLIAYAAGIAKMNYPKFILASFLGMVPSNLFLVTLGVTALSQKVLIYFLIVVYVVGTMFAPQIIRKLVRHKF